MYLHLKKKNENKKNFGVRIYDPDHSLVNSVHFEYDFCSRNVIFIALPLNAYMPLICMF